VATTAGLSENARQTCVYINVNHLDPNGKYMYHLALKLRNFPVCQIMYLRVACCSDNNTDYLPKQHY
jgi:hypothetical protein